MTDLHHDLNALLADHQVLYQKLRNYHWTVRGPHFFALHSRFEALYDTIAERTDAIAERLMALGGRPLATLAQALEISRIEEDSEARAAEFMVQKIASDLDSVRTEVRRVAADAAERGDAATANLLDGFADADEKTLWMLRAFLGKA